MAGNDGAHGEHAIQLLAITNEGYPINEIITHANEFMAQNPHTNSAAIVAHVQQIINQKMAGKPAPFVGGKHHDQPVPLFAQGWHPPAGYQMARAARPIRPAPPGLMPQLPGYGLAVPQAVQPPPAAPQVPLFAQGWRPPAGFQMAPSVRPAPPGSMPQLAGYGLAVPQVVQPVPRPAGPPAQVPLFAQGWQPPAGYQMRPAVRPWRPGLMPQLPGYGLAVPQEAQPMVRPMVPPPAHQQPDALLPEFQIPGQVQPPVAHQPHLAAQLPLMAQGLHAHDIFPIEDFPVEPPPGGFGPLDELYLANPDRTPEEIRYVLNIVDQQMPNASFREKCLQTNFRLHNPYLYM